MRSFLFCIIFAIVIFSHIPLVSAQATAVPDAKPIALQNDSLQKTTSADSLSTDSVPRKKSVLDAPVTYTAKDSIVFTGNNMGYLYGDGNIKYQSIDLTAQHISIAMDSSIVTAIYGIDSVGDKFGFPNFKDGDQAVDAKTMRYNFKSKKGYITGALTEQGEGFLNADRAKRNADGSFFICDGKYTTCDDHENPHFHIHITKALVRPGKDVVAGPAYLVIEGLPLKMIGLPFAFFPFTDKYSSGIIMPSYGDEMEKGFNLRDGGYYFALSDHIDLALTGEIYTKGSWGINARSSYRTRYKYSGSFDGSYLVSKFGDKESPDYDVQKTFSLNWSHSQDAKANMYRTLSANVRFSSSAHDRNQVSSINNPQLYTDGNRSSSVNFNQRFPNSPWSFNGSMSINQTLSDSTLAITLPNLTVSMSRIYPFKAKDRAGDEKWYEKISMSYSGDFRNSIRTKEDKLFKSDFMKDWQKDMKHSIPISATFSLFNYFNISPSFNYDERWYTSGVRQKYENGSHIAADTIYGFKRIYSYSMGVSVQTKVYGFYEPLVNVFGIKKIRHVFTPNISLGYTPDFGDDLYGFYEKYYYLDQYGDRKEHAYSPYTGIVLGPSSGQQGSINFDFQNNIEAKVLNANDSLVTKSIIDNLGIRFNYNMMAPIYKWSDISTGLRIKFSKSLTVNLNGTFDPYTYSADEKGRVTKDNKLRISQGKFVGRLRSTGYSISPSINQDSFKNLWNKWFGKEEESEDKGKDSSDKSGNMDATGIEGDAAEADKPKRGLLEKKTDDKEYDADGYVKNHVQWNLSMNYSMNYGWSNEFDYSKSEYKGKITHNFGLNGSIQPTKNWSFSFTTSYDFDAKKFAYANCNISRNLHCWGISASFTPVGPYQSYFVSLRVNSSMLQDLKYEQRGRTSSYDPKWY